MLDLWFCEGGVEDKFGWDNGQQNGRETIGLSSNESLDKFFLNKYNNKGQTRGKEK